MMGLDCKIFYKLKDGVEDADIYFPPNFTTIDPGGNCPPGATHSLDSYYRYWSPWYQRGPWGEISSALMTLYNHPDVETVWYCSDCSEYETEKPFTKQNFMGYIYEFINGNKE